MADKLGNYEIQGELGRGGMGVVYKATDTRLGRTVAIKELICAPTMADAEKQDTVERFRREAMAAARLSHPNIVTVFDFGQDGDRHYMAMELLEGKSLGDYLEKKVRFSVQQVVDISAQVCMALDYAHQAGVVHRDIKPDNVMLSESGAVKLADFGVARVKSDLPSMTQTGTTLGTIAYISPEQLVDSREVDGRADLFSLGAMIYEMLTFKTPFDAGNLGGTIVNIMNMAPTPICEINPQIPPKLEAVVMRALKKNPDERFARAAEMGHALQAAIRDMDKQVAQPAAAPAAAPAAPVACRHCGTELAANSRVCQSCGRSGTAPLTLNVQAPRPAAAAGPAPGSPGGPPRMPQPTHAGPLPGAPGGPPRMPTPTGPLSGAPGGPPRMPTSAGPIPGTPGAPPRMPAGGQAAPRPAAIPTMPGRGTGPLTPPGSAATVQVRTTPPVIEDGERPAPPVVLRAQTLKALSTFGKQGVGQSEFQQPRCIQFDGDRGLWVADTENGRIQIFNTGGHLVHTVKPNPAIETFRFPRSLAFTSRGYLYVTDDLDHRIFRLDLMGQQLAVWKRPREEGPTVPGRIMVGHTGHIYVSEPNTHRVLVYDAEEHLIGMFGREHGLHSPGGLAQAANGDLLVLDFGMSCIHVFNPKGEKVGEWGKRGAAPGEFAVPRDLAVDKYGCVYVADTLNHRIQVLDPEGRFLTAIGRKGFGFGDFNGPEGLVVGPEDKLFVTDRGNNRVQLLQIGRT